MKKLLIVLALVTGASAPAEGKILTLAKYLALRISLTVQPDGTATLTNVSDTAMRVWGFEFYSTLGRFDPANARGWRSLSDWCGQDSEAAEAALGPDVFGFTEIRATSTVLAEANMNGFAVFEPGVSVSIGKPFKTPIDPADHVTFYYTREDFLGDKFLGAVTIVPEPAALPLAAMGAAVVICGGGGARRLCRAMRRRTHSTPGLDAGGPGGRGRRLQPALLPQPVRVSASSGDRAGGRGRRMR